LFPVRSRELFTLAVRKGRKEGRKEGKKKGRKGKKE
jgi:hypothetical protein